MHSQSQSHLPDSLPHQVLPTSPRNTQLQTDQFAILGAYRLFLALVVCTGHIASNINPNDWTQFGLWLNQGSATFGFFVISGYTMACRLSAGTKDYFRWRFIRVYPVYMANMALALVASTVIGDSFSWPLGIAVPPPTTSEVLGTAFMLVQIATSYIGVDGQAWCIDTDWWMCACGPIFYRFFPWTLGLMALCSMWIYMDLWRVFGNGPNLWAHGGAFGGVLWMWLGGFLYGRVRHLKLAVFVPTVPAVMLANQGIFIGVPFMCAGVTLVIAPYIRVAPGLRKALFWFGDLAIPLYLCHTVVAAVLCKAAITSSMVIVASSLTVSVLLVQFIDYPCRKRFEESN